MQTTRKYLDTHHHPGQEKRANPNHFLVAWNIVAIHAKDDSQEGRKGKEGYMLTENNVSEATFFLFSKYI